MFRSHMTVNYRENCFIVRPPGLAVTTVRQMTQDYQVPGLIAICVKYFLNNVVCLFVVVVWTLRAKGVMTPKHLRDCRRHPSGLYKDHTFRKRVMFQSFPPEHTPPVPSVSLPPTHQIMLNKNGPTAVVQGNQIAMTLLDPHDGFGISLWQYLSGQELDIKSKLDRL